MRPWRTVAAGMVVVCSVVVAAASSGSERLSIAAEPVPPDATVPDTGPGPTTGDGEVSAQAVVSAPFDYTDISRGASCANVSSSSRRTTGTIYYDDTKSNLPVLFLLHGFGGVNPVEFTPLAQKYANRGYFVVVPNFPVTSNSIPPFNFFPSPLPTSCASDIKNQPGDVSFVLTSLTAELGSTLPTGLFDPNRTGVRGGSGGGITGLLFFNTCCTDTRIRAVWAEKSLPLESTAGDPAYNPGGAYDFTRPIALLMANGCVDSTLDQGTFPFTGQASGPGTSIKGAWRFWAADDAPKYFFEDPNPAFNHNVQFFPIDAAAPDAFLDRYVLGDTGQATLAALLAPGSSPDYRYLTEVAGAPSNTSNPPCVPPELTFTG